MPSFCRWIKSNRQLTPTTSPLPITQKIKLYIAALLSVPFYRYGEIGNICYTVGKNILDGVILYTMFSMAEQELKVAAILGVVVKYAYPGITMISSTYTSGFIDHLEAARDIKMQIRSSDQSTVGNRRGTVPGRSMPAALLSADFYVFFCRRIL